MTVRTDHGEPAWTVSLGTVARQWGRIGCLGFGGPPTHIVMLRDLCVDRRQWLTSSDFEDAVVACNLLPGPASTQLAIYCASRIRGRLGALVGGLAFILPGLILVLALASLFLQHAPPRSIAGAGAGAGAAVAAVAVHAGVGLIPPSWRRSSATLASAMGSLRFGGRDRGGNDQRIPGFGADPVRRHRDHDPHPTSLRPDERPARGSGHRHRGRQHGQPDRRSVDCVQSRRPRLWRRVRDHPADTIRRGRPLPLDERRAAVGYAAAGIGGGLLAAGVAFAPSFAFILVGGDRFDRLRANAIAQTFLVGAGPAAIGAILGSAIPLARAITQAWQLVILLGAGVVLLVFRRGVVTTLIAAAAVGAVVSAAGGPLPH